MTGGISALMKNWRQQILFFHNIGSYIATGDSLVFKLDWSLGHQQLLGDAVVPPGIPSANDLIFKKTLINLPNFESK